MKRLNLNTLVIIILLVTIGISFISLYVVSIDNVEQCGNLIIKMTDSEIRKVNNEMTKSGKGHGMLAKSDLSEILIKNKKQIISTHSNITKNFIYIFLITFIISFLLAFILLKKYFVRPIEHFRNKAKLLGSGNFKLKFPEKGIQEIFDLSKTFNTLVLQLEDYIEKLKKEVAERESVENSIKLARRIQGDILPVLGKQFDTSEFSLKAKLLPAKEVSGDFYDGFFLDENKIAFLIADVSGKGFPAAFFMAIARTTIKNIALTEYNDPAIVLEKTNKILSSENMSSMFVTIFLGYYEINTGKLVYANGGHHTAMNISKSGQIEEFGSVNDTALGIIGISKYTKQEIILQHGSSILLYTDGAVEAISKSGEEFKKTRLIKYLKNNYSKASELVVNGLVNEVVKFQGGSLFDDVTVCMLTRTK
ncbi:MAG TPA: SpoIIE family protein phosphatase [Victivallales bacterium]|nr:SpoIIE family protein phosphatase [Victivallales bacterium]